MAKGVVFRDATAMKPRTRSKLRNSDRADKNAVTRSIADNDDTNSPTVALGSICSKQ